MAEINWMDNVASFGKTMFDASAVADYKKMLASYDKIAVRENCCGNAE